MVNSLKGEQAFLNSLADTLTKESVYKNRITGPAGSMADATSLATTLKPKVMWCADGEFCNVPDGKNININKSSYLQFGDGYNREVSAGQIGLAEKRER